MLRPSGARALIALAGLGCIGAAGAHAQTTMRGTVLDASNGQPIPLTGIYLLDSERNHLALAMADSLGRYFLEVPEPGEYLLVAQRFGYNDMESPLLSLDSPRTYALDLELHPAPVGLEGLTVSVSNERVIEWLTLELGGNPRAAFGFRVLQGERLAEAKLRGRNRPTETMRWLYIPVSHGPRCVSINSVPRAQRGGWRGARGSVFGDPGSVPAGTTVPSAAPRDDEGRGSCGRLYVDDIWMPNAHLEEIDMTSIATIVTLPGSVRMYTYGFDWGFR